MNKIVSTILLDEKNTYVYEDGSLPIRTQWDKELLSTFLLDENVSGEGFRMLPDSLGRKVAGITPGEPYPITVPEIDGLTDILLVTRGQSKAKPGKKFRFDKFTCILKEQRLEIWKRDR